MSLRSSWLTLLFASLLFVGCGKDEPAAKSVDKSTDDDAQTQPKDDASDDNDVTADKGEKKTSDDDADAASNFDVSYITEDFVAAVSIRPSAIVGSPLVADIRKVLIAQFGEKFFEEDLNSRRLFQQIEGIEQAFGINLFQIEEILVLVDKQVATAGPGMFSGRDVETFDDDAPLDSEDKPSDPDDAPSDDDDASSDDDDACADDADDAVNPGESGPPPLPAAVVRFGQKIDREKLLMPFRRNLGELIEKQHAGHDYLVSSTMGVAAHFADDQTVVIAPEETLKKMLTAKNVDSPLIQQLKTAGRHQFILAVDLAAMSDLVTRLATAGPEAIGQVADKVKGFTIAVDIDGDSILMVSVLTGSDADATGLAQAAKGYLAMGQGMYAFSKGQQLEGATPETLKLVPLIDSLVAGVSVNQNGTSVALTVKTPEGLDKLPELLKPLIAEAQAAAKQAGRRSNLKQIGLAMHNYHDLHGELPTADGLGFDPDKFKPGLLSWRVYLLPQLDHPSTFADFHLDEPWDSEHNKQFIKQMPKVFGDDPDGKTKLHVFTGKGTPLGGKTALRFNSITDGLSNVIAVVETGPDKAEIWTKPGGLPFDAKNPIAALGKIGDKFLAVLFDDRVIELPKTIKPETLSRLIQHADGESVEIP